MRVKSRARKAGCVYVRVTVASGRAVHRPVPVCKLGYRGLPRAVFARVLRV